MTTITLPRATVEQALHAMRRAVPTGKITLYEWDKSLSDLGAALAQQAEPVEPPKPAPLKRGTTGRCTRKVCECEKEGLGPECIYLEPVIDGYPLWSGIPKAELVAGCETEADCTSQPWCRISGECQRKQAEPDHETRAELAEQQVVQLAEERDHYRNLWQKAQQAEPQQATPSMSEIERLRAERDALADRLREVRESLIDTIEDYRRKVVMNAWAEQKPARHGIPMPDQDQPEPEDNNPSFG